MSTPRNDGTGTNHDSTPVGVVEVVLIVFGLMAMASSLFMPAEDVAGKFFAIVVGVLALAFVSARAAWLRHRS